MNPAWMPQSVSAVKVAVAEHSERLAALEAGPMEPDRFPAAVVAGSIGTGSQTNATHNTQAIQEAIEVGRVSGRTPLVPQGWHYINDTLDLSEYVEGLRGCGGRRGQTTLLWCGPNDGRPMIRMRAKWQRLEDITLIGDGQSNSYAGATVTGVGLEPGAEGNFVGNTLRNIRIASCKNGLRVTRPAAARGQCEGVRLESCRFDGCETGASLEHRNIDYWTWIDTYWAGCLTGISADAGDSSGCNGHTFIGCVATGNWTNVQGTWIRVVNQGGWGTWQFVNCQTEALQWAVEHSGLGHITIDGAWLGGLRLDNSSAPIVVRNSAIGIESGVAGLETAIHVVRGYANLHVTGTRFTVNGQYVDGFREFLAAGGVTTDQAGSVASRFWCEEDARYGRRFDKPIDARQLETYGWANQPTLDVRGGWGVSAPIARFADKTGAVAMEVAAAGPVLRSPDGSRWLLSVSNAGTISAVKL